MLYSVGMLLEKRLKALADGTRLKLLALLSLRPCCVCEMAEVIGFAQPTISRHLQRLVEAGLISFEKRGNYQIYRLAPADEKAKKLITTVLDMLAEENILPGLEKALKKADKRYLWEDL
ncbi:ArsR/SmtB family transcription factor [Thermodesulfatator indicus]